jgi:hypothetical protein
MSKLFLSVNKWFIKIIINQIRIIIILINHLFTDKNNLLIAIIV